THMGTSTEVQVIRKQVGSAVLWVFFGAVSGCLSSASQGVPDARGTDGMPGGGADGMPGGGADGMPSGGSLGIPLDITSRTGPRTLDAVAMSADGSFVVTSHDISFRVPADAEPRAARARRFDASGRAMCDEFVVNSLPAQAEP